MRRGLEIRNTSAAVVLLQIVGDGLGVGVADRRAESLDHLGDAGIPHSRTWERRVHLNVVEAVAHGAVVLDHVEAGSFLRLIGFSWAMSGVASSVAKSARLTLRMMSSLTPR